MRAIRRGRWLVVAVIALFAVFAAACGDSKKEEGSSSDTSPAGQSDLTGGPADGPTPQEGGSMVMALEAETQTGWNSVNSPFAVSGHYVASAVFDPLVTLDEEGNATPFLATAIEPNDSFTEWVMTVPQGVTFHDGTPLTPQVVANNMQAYRDSAITGLVFRLIDSVEVRGDAVVIGLSQPWASFPFSLATQAGYIMSQSMLDVPAMSETPVGTGPFEFVEWVKGERWRGRKFDEYWRKDAEGRALPYLDELEFRPISDHGERIQLLETGSVDAMITYRPTDILALREDPEFKRVEYRGEEDVLAMNAERPPFNNLTARQAVAFASDTERWRNEINLGVMQETNSPFAPGQIGYVEDNGLPQFDIERAKELVKSYEEQTGQKLSFTYLSTGAPDDLRESQMLVEDWTEAGMEVQIQTSDQANLIALVVLGEYQLSDWRNWGMPDPAADTVWWHSASVVPQPEISLNVARYKDPEIDAAIEESMSTTDRETRDQAFQRIAHRFGSQVPYIMLGRVDWMLAAQPRVNGIFAASNGTLSSLGPKTWLATLWMS
jgi:peptide/nickel transport system substrate-binding protein